MGKSLTKRCTFGYNVTKRNIEWRYFKMKKTSNARLRRILAMIAALTILLSCLSGCMKDPAEDETDPSESTPPTAAITEPTTEATTTPPETTEPKAPSVMGTVNTNNLNIRTSPASTSTIVSQLDAGERVEILEQRTSDGVNWGRIEKGWISLAYVTLDGQVSDNADNDTKVEDPTTPTKTETPISGTATNQSGTITASQLNIRKGPGTSYDAVGKYYNGDKVTITETKDGWGKTDKGWVSLKYVSGTTASTGNTTTTTDSKYTTLVTNGSTTSLGTVKITIGALNVRYGPGSSYDVVTKVTNGTSHTYYQKNGDWVRIKDGWIYTKGYTDIGGGTTSGTATNQSGTITASQLNIRKGPGTSYEAVGKYYNGDKVTITETKDGWGKTDKGWISMKYVSTSGTTSSTTTGTKGTITASSLNVRKEPNKTSEKVGGYLQGDTVTILETKDGWGRTDKGWISMNYVKTN